MTHRQPYCAVYGTIRNFHGLPWVHKKPPQEATKAINTIMENVVANFTEREFENQNRIPWIYPTIEHTFTCLI